MKIELTKYEAENILRPIFDDKLGLVVDEVIIGDSTPAVDAKNFISIADVSIIASIVRTHGYNKIAAIKELRETFRRLSLAEGKALVLAINPN